MNFETPAIFPVPAELLQKMQGVVLEFFPAECRRENNEDFRLRCSIAQQHMKERVTSQEVLVALNVFGPGMRVQNEMYLRAQRPQLEGQAVGWHRECMYGCPKEAYNVWIPVMNCVEENAVRFVPGSASIPDEEIGIVQDISPDVRRGSPGHRIGLLYAPKRIVSGVDFGKAVPLIVPQGSCAVFDSNLIHGAAINNTNLVRFSCDFRTISESALVGNKEHLGGLYWR